ncbi:YigZ family protein [Sphingobacterium sp. DK4209]|uniref:YigZ family protein n=1 Tax=Sphingobacterium zhuxiongii TaxID=2662364 RepID=A0A5Q0Q8I5_9SPHI|nr:MULTISPECIES: YigZ family protein [unclassified Sphingobacterium]MVZ64348.1 YigZ family protein [Sphingobacterium sp. DK4209]QGA25696.1 YigZ family protein [Sphingobacterium sp. dk4302]
MSLFDDTYKTIEEPSEGIFRDKGSKFIAYAYPFKDESKLKEIIALLKAEHPKARHHCWAYRLTPDRTVFRVNDDGEPSGTAGRPILNVLLSQDITNLLVVVVRYFGGTLLGVPGLINAYKTATQEAIDNNVIVERTVNDIYAVHFDYLQMNDVMKIVKEYDLKVLSQNFDTSCTIHIEMRKLQVNELVGKLESIEGIEVDYLRTI